MKKAFLLTITIISSIIIFAQDTSTTYYNRKMLETDKANAHFYHKAFANKDGSWTVIEYYINGQLKMKGTYKNKRLSTRHGYFEYYYENGGLEKKGYFHKDKAHGEWTFYFESGERSSLEVYKKNERVAQTFWDREGNEVPLEKAEYPPEFPGGWQAYTAFLTDNINYPKSAREIGLQGRVIVRLDCDENGMVTDRYIIRSVHPLLDDEALRVMQNLKEIKPGKKHNRINRVFYAPVNFTLK